MRTNIVRIFLLYIVKNFTNYFPLLTNIGFNAILLQDNGRIIFYSLIFSQNISGQ